MYSQSVPALISKNVGNTLTNYKTWGGILHVVDAKGDGSDSTVAIQKTIDAAIAAGDNAVFFLTGAYSATALTNINAVDLFGNNATLTIGGQEYKIDNFAKAGQSVIVYNRAISEIESSFPIDSLKQARKAIDSGTLRVTYWGDSITEGAEVIVASESYANRLDNAIKTALKGVNIVSANYSLGGRYSTQTLDANFKGLASEPTDPATGFFRSWSTVGKSWLQSVKDFAPDLIFYAFGMNDVSYNPGNADKIIADNIQSLISTVSTWSPVPSIVLVTPLLPTKNTTLYSQSQNMTRATARSIRESGYNNGLPVADAERLYEILRDGYDDATRSTTLKESNFLGYGTSSWIGDTTGFTLSGSTLTPINSTPKSVTRVRTFYNGSVQVDINHVNAADRAWINYRQDNFGNMSVFVTPGAAGAGSVGLYRGDTGTLIQNVTGLTIPLGTFKQLKVEVNGSKHTVYWDGVKIMDNIITYHKMSNGNVNLGSQQSSPVYANLIITYADPINTEALYTEKLLLSVSGINHPSALGHALFYIPAFNGVLSNLASVKATPPYIAPTLLNGWLNFGGTEATAGYYKDAMNIVRIKGMVKTGTINTPIFNLPIGYRPSETMRFASVSADAFCYVIVNTNGDVTSFNGVNTWVAISLSFRV